MRRTGNTVIYMEKFGSQFWLEYVTRKLQETQPCGLDYIIGRHLLAIFQKETGTPQKKTKVMWKGLNFQCWDYPGNPQPFDTIYAACLNYEARTENHQVSSLSNCGCANRAHIGLHTWIIVPPNLNTEQEEIYTVFRRDGTAPAAAYEISRHI